MKKAARKLSGIDKKIIKALLSTFGRVSTYNLSTELGVPRTTVQHRRAFLEKNYLEFSYNLKLHCLGYRRVDLLVYTGKGESVKIAENLLKRDEVVCVGRSVGEPTIDLRVEVIVKDNGQLLELLEEVRTMPNVRDVVWSEIVEVVGRNSSVPNSIIDQL